MRLNSLYLLKNASLTTVCRAVGIALGVVLDALVLAVFGMGRETDAYFVALGLPLILCEALNVEAPKVLVPFITKSLQESREQTWKFIGSLACLSALAISLLCLAGMIAAGQLVAIQVPGLDGDTISLASQLMMVVIWLVLLRGLSTILDSYLFCRDHFVVPTSSKFVGNAAALVGIVVFWDHLSILVVAAGQLAGAVLQLALLYLTARSKGFRFRPCFDLHNRRLRKCLKLLAYPLSGFSLIQSIRLVENFVASFMGAGSVTLLRYASRILESAAGVIMGGIQISSLPLISRQASSDRIAEMKESLLLSMKFLTFVSLPLAIWLIFTAKPLLTLLFQRGQVTQQEILQVSALIAILAPSVVFGRAVALMKMAFLGKLEMKVPFISVVISYATNLSGLALLIGWMGIYGIPASRTLATMVTAAATAWMLGKRFGAFRWGGLLRFEGRLLVASAVMALGLTGGLYATSWAPLGGLWSRLAGFVVPTALGGTLFLLACLLLGLISKAKLGEIFRGGAEVET